MQYIIAAQGMPSEFSLKNTQLWGVSAACIGDLDGRDGVNLAVGLQYDPVIITHGQYEGPAANKILNLDGTGKSYSRLSSVGGMPSSFPGDVAGK